MTQAPASLRLCRWTLWGLRLALLVVVLAPLAAWCSPWLGLPALSPLFAALPWQARLAGLATALPAMLVSFALILQWSRVFKRFAAGAFLELDVANAIQRAGWLGVLLVPARVLTGMLSSLALGIGREGGSLQLSIGSTELFILLAGLICVALGRVWSDAARIHDEWRHTV